MLVHGVATDDVSEHAYNWFRVRNLSQLYFFADYLPFQDRVCTKMEEKGEGMWVSWCADWFMNEFSISTLFLWIKFLNNRVMNNRTIPSICQYSEWAVLDAAKMQHTMEGFKNMQSFATNSAKWNLNAPRGARFSACPPKWDSNKPEQQRWS